MMLVSLTPTAFSLLPLQFSSSSSFKRVANVTTRRLRICTTNPTDSRTRSTRIQPSPPRHLLKLYRHDSRSSDFAGGRGGTSSDVEHFDAVRSGSRGRRQASGGRVERGGCVDGGRRVSAFLCHQSSVADPDARADRRKTRQLPLSGPTSRHLLPSLQPPLPYKSTLSHCQHNPVVRSISLPPRS